MASPGWILFWIPSNPGHQHRTERQIHIARRIGEPDFDPLGFGAWGIHRNANARRTVATGIG